MRLDRTRIAIVERNQRDLLDLAFLVLRSFFVPLVSLTLALALPLAILNYFLLEWMAADLIEFSTIRRYAWSMTLLVYIQAPLATMLATAYLGKATFYEEPTLKQLVRDVALLGYRIIWTQLLQRGVLLALWLVVMMEREDATQPAEVWLVLLCVGLFFWRSTRPYINEIVLLERSPIRSRHANQITIGRRSGRLHGPNGGDLFGRGITCIPVTLSLGCAIFGLFWFTIATFSNDWGLGPIMLHVAYPATLWCLAVYMTVYRFLSYLDLRIRREGWEVELKMRAEAARIDERIAYGNG